MLKTHHFDIKNLFYGAREPLPASHPIGYRDTPPYTLLNVTLKFFTYVTIMEIRSLTPLVPSILAPFALDLGASIQTPY